MKAVKEYFYSDVVQGQKLKKRKKKPLTIEQMAFRDLQHLSSEGTRFTLAEANCFRWGFKRGDGQSLKTFQDVERESAASLLAAISNELPKIQAYLASKITPDDAADPLRVSAGAGYKTILAAYDELFEGKDV